MPKLTVFNNVSLDGFFSDAHGDMSFAHKSDPEWTAFASENASGGGALLFGRVTYAMMASFWPTPQAMKSAPVLAERMNSLPKIVFSRTMDQAAWSNTRLVKSDPVEEVHKLKSGDGPNMAILGSGTIVSLLAQAGLIDELQIVVNPLVLGQGRTMFETVQKRLPLTLTKTRAFGNGNVLLCYGPA